jgi:tRNA G18 (ribose-2'-O)-methylase SpoU
VRLLKIRENGKILFDPKSSHRPLHVRTRFVPQIIEIDDATDDRLKCYANLHSSAIRLADSSSFIAEGRWCVQRLLESNHAILSVLAERGKETELSSLLADETPLYSLPSDQIRQLVGFDFHRGVLACGRRPTVKDVNELRFRAGAPPVALAALGGSEHENLGSMIRTATALGIEHLLVGPKTVDPFHRRSIRVSMATVFKQNLYRIDQPDRQLGELERSGNVRTIVTTLDRDATPLEALQVDHRESLLIVGNEAAGVDRQIQDLATDRVTIPMLGTDSLNVSVAAAICMYHLIGQYRR